MNMKFEELLLDAVKRLEASPAKKVFVAEYVPQKRVLFFKKKAHFVKLDEAWALGVLLLSTTGEIYAAGETTRAIAPGYPGHTSSERERRRAFTKAAFESGFETGQVIYFDSPKINIYDPAEVERSTVLLNHEGKLKVKWNKHAAPDAAILFSDYISEQVSLRE